jgi:UDP-N-acetylmuramoyl-tripeptide--D-alanyl-D-alanine ligase
VNAIALTAARVVEGMRAAGAELVAGDGNRELAGVSIDTRTIARGDLFIAIRGERFDGAQFAAEAIDKGAAGIVVDRSAAGWSATAVAERAVVIVVDDTIAALQALAGTIRRESGTKVVAITGSAGKTTTKEMTSELLSLRHRVIRNRGNLNNHIGLPLSLVDLRQRPDIAVVELGMNHPGEIRTLVQIAEPDVRVWTNVGEAHLGHFASVDAIADAKAEIFDGAGPSTRLVANADDDRIMARVPRFRGRVTTFGIDRDADVRATAVVDRGIDGLSARLVTADGAADVALGLVGRANLANLLAAAAVALDFGIPLAAIADRASRLTAAAHRGEVLRLAGGVTVLDDSYNANPTATRLALAVLARTTATRRVAVLGEMLELGARAIALHEEVGRAAAASGVDLLFAVGGAPAAALAEAAVAAGLPRASVRHVAASDQAAGEVAARVLSGDVVLVKGSRGIRTDRVVERLKGARG